MPILRLTILLALFLFCQQSQAQSIRFGVVPQQSASRLANLWIPLLNEISERSGVSLTFATASNIDEFEANMLAGAYDIAYINPYHYTIYSQKPGYTAFAKEKDKFIRGIIVTHNSSNIKDLTELDRLPLAFPAPNSFAATILIQSELRKRGVSFTPHYVQSHDSVYLAVATGKFVAGGGITRTLNSIPSQTRDSLKILYTTPPYTPHAIASHPRVSNENVEKILKAMISLSEDSNGNELLKPLTMNGFVSATDQDWNDVRSLEIKLLNNEHPAGQ